MDNSTNSPPSTLHPPPTAVLLMNYGGPERPEDCEAYIRNIFLDPALIPMPGFLRPWVAARAAHRRAPHLEANYAAMGRMSPIREQTEAQASALQDELGEGFRCFVGMRYWAPSIGDTLAAIRAERFRRLVLLPLYPQESRSTTGSCLAEADRCLRAMGWEPEVWAVRSFWQEPGFLRAVREGIEGALGDLPPGAAVLYSAHGLPLSAARGDPYPGQVESTVRALQEGLRWGAPYELAWQSRVGPMRWLEPSVEVTLSRWADQGRLHFALVPVAFVSEHSETLYELDVLYAGSARERGMQVRRAPTVQCHPAFVSALASSVSRSVRAPAGRISA